MAAHPQEKEKAELKLALEEARAEATDARQRGEDLQRAPERETDATRQSNLGGP